MQVEEIDDIAETIPLLSACGLPTADLLESSSATLFGVRIESNLVATAGIELFGQTALLRSVATLPAQRGKGLAALLITHAEHKAKQGGAASMALLTTASSSIFARHGYLPIERRDAPEAIKATQQFESLCPASATLMLKVLN